MKISAEGLALIKKFEGCELEAYQDAVGVWTIGYGHIKGVKKDIVHMHKGIHELGGKIDKIYWVLLGTVGAVSLVLIEWLISIV